MAGSIWKSLILAITCLRLVPGVQASASAVPTPCTARAHRKSGQSGAAAQAAQPTAEIARPIWKTRRWPNRSPSLPHTSISEP